MKPNFIIAGAPKSATSWLVNALKRHPDTYLPRSELHFFNIKENFARGFDWYCRKFDPGRGRRAIGEKTPNYMWITPAPHESRFGTHLPNIHKAIHRLLPDVKLIFVLRDPVDRLVSAFNHYRRSGQFSPYWDLEDVVFGHKAHLGEKYGLIDMGLYAKHLEAYYQLFDQSRLKVIITETDIKGAADKTLEDICRFLDIDPGHPEMNPEKEVNSFDPIRVSQAYLNYLNPFPNVKSFKRGARFASKILRGPPLKKYVPDENILQQIAEIYAGPNRILFNLIDRQDVNWK